MLDNKYDYLLLVSKYFSKNTTCIKKGMLSTDVLHIAVQKKRDLKWFKLLFNLCSQVNVVPPKNVFEKALSEKNFHLLSKQCQSMIQENYNKFYPKK